MDIAQAIASMQEGTKLVVPKGTYEVPVNTIKLKKGTTLDLRGATLKMLPSDKKSYRMIEIAAPDVTVMGGTLIGDRDYHKGPADGSGYGIITLKGAKNVTIGGTRLMNMWLDGIMVNGGENIVIENVNSDNNRRQGLSVCEVSRLRVTGSTFQNTRGTGPSAGIDFEPFLDTAVIEDVLVSKCAILNNHGHGITINATHGKIRRLTVKDDCLFKGNRKLPLNYWHWPFWLEWLADLGLYKPTSISI